MAFGIIVLGFYIAVLVLIILASRWMIRSTSRRLEKGPGLFITMISLVQLATLIHTTFVPGHGGAFVLFRSQGASIRGWPFAWFGINNLEDLLAPFYLAADTIFWTMATCLIFRLGKRLVAKLHGRYNRLAEILAATSLLFLGILLSTLCIPLNAIGSIP